MLHQVSSHASDGQEQGLPAWQVAHQRAAYRATQASLLLLWEQLDYMGLKLVTRE